MSKIFHYEVESDFEDDDMDRYEETHFEKEEGSEYQDTNEDEFQEMIMDSYSEQQQEVKQEWQEKNWDDDKQSVEDVEQTQGELQEPVQQQSEEEVQQTMELRVFAGNIGQGPLFHSISISASTTADDLIKTSVNKFGMMDTTSSEDTTIEYYIAVQGMDGGKLALFFFSFYWGDN
jgi:hypothetical protein